jgi:hypothetical protein
MDPNTGKLYAVPEKLSEEEARTRGFVPVPPEDEDRVRRMNRKQRRAWAARQRAEKK